MNAIFCLFFILFILNTFNSELINEILKSILLCYLNDTPNDEVNFKHLLKITLYTHLLQSDAIK